MSLLDFHSHPVLFKQPSHLKLHFLSIRFSDKEWSKIASPYLSKNFPTCLILNSISCEKLTLSCFFAFLVRVWVGFFGVFFRLDQFCWWSCLACFSLSSPKISFSSTELCSTRLIVSHSKHVTGRSVFLFDEHQKTQRSGLPRWITLGWQDLNYAGLAGPRCSYFSLFHFSPHCLPIYLQLTLLAGTATVHFTPHITFKCCVKEKPGSKFTVKIFASYFLASHSFSVMPL